jgi:hypothetical protein
MYCLGQIGEIATKIPEIEQRNYPGIFWEQMVGLRHRLFHDYEGDGGGNICGGMGIALSYLPVATYFRPECLLLEVIGVM